MDPTHYDALIRLASCQGTPGTEMAIDEAKTLLETAILNKPNEWKAYDRLAALLHRLGNKKEAKEMYHSALVRLPDTENECTRSELEKQIQILEEVL